jgi:hypothetical protein
VCGISDSNAGYTMFRDSVKSTGSALHSPVSSSLPQSRASPCAITFQLDPTNFRPFLFHSIPSLYRPSCTTKTARFPPEILTIQCLTQLRPSSPLQDPTVYVLHCPCSGM